MPREAILSSTREARRARARQRTERRVAARDPGSLTAVSLTAAYFASHLLAAGRSSSCHIPPAFTQSSRFLYWLKSRDVSLGGLAEGELDEFLDALGVVVAPLGSLDVAGGFVTLPEESGLVPGPPDPCRGLFGLVLPGAPLLTCAAAMAGARAMIPTKSISMSFCM
jgi:hypothetical protein